ncbi:MAG: BglG family transcription antiterminator [Kyrpidia sp.]|nr:BglG family transcription antiterminator [Kyrpidia sp.]
MDSRLTARQKRVLMAAYRKERTTLSALADRLGISARTLQRDVRALKDYLQDFGVSLNVSAQGGLTLDGGSDAIERVLDRCRPFEFSSPPGRGPRERELYIALELLQTNGPLKIAYFSRRLQVAEASISLDLDRLERWLAQHRLLLVRKRGYGVEVVGKEDDKRRALVALIYRAVPVHRMIDTLSGGAEHENEEIPRILSQFDPALVRRVRRVLRQRIGPPAESLFDAGAFYSFMLHVLVSVQRIRSGFPIREIPGGEPGTRTGKEAEEYRRIRQLLREIDPVFDEFPGEVMYLTKHWLGSRGGPGILERILPHKITILDLAHRIAAEVTARIGIPLTGDAQLLHALSQHLEPTLYRLNEGMVIRNPLLKEVREYYPTLFEVVKEAAFRVLGQLGHDVPDEEIGYLTMHVGAAVERWHSQTQIRVQVVCPNGMSSAELLAERIRAVFPSFEIVRMTAAGDLGERTDCDLVLSTVPLPQCDRAVTVSPFLTEEDIQKVGRFLERRVVHDNPEHTARQYRAVRRFQETPAEPIVRTITVRAVQARTLEDLVHHIAGDVHRTGRAKDPDDVARALLEREKLGSVVIPGKRLALLHARCRSMTRAHIGVYRLDRPLVLAGIGMDKEQVDTILTLLVHPEAPKEVIAAMSLISSALITVPGFVEQLRTADPDDLPDHIAGALHSLGGHLS